MQEKPVRKGHNFILENRSKLLLSGITDVGSFNDREVDVFTDLGELKIKGSDLQITNISIESGNMELNGKIDGLVYSDNVGRVPDNFITKLFR